MALIPQPILRTAILSCLLIIVSLVSLLDQCKPSRYVNRHIALPSKQYSVDKGRLDLSEGECRSAYPLILKETDTSIARGPFHFPKSNPDYKGLVQARIRNNALYVLSAAPDSLPQILHQRTAVLSQIHRALLTSPTMLPNITFAFSINDMPKNNSWAFSRPNKHSSYNIWLMPLFTSWSWPKPTLGTMDTILQLIDAIEHNNTWDNKIDKAVWRGTTWFNPLGHPDLRKQLIKVARGKEWADIAVLDASSALSIEDFCRYKYVLYTEGVTYSGRLPYHQACESVLIMAPVTWSTVSAAMLRPIWSQSLFSEGGNSHRVGQQILEGPRGALPTVASVEDADAIYVKPDFSDLEALIRFLRAHPEVAKQIARNQRRVMSEGYLGMAAEMCYWRALIRGWAVSTQVDDKEWNEFVEERYETWLLKEVSKNRDGTIGKSTYVDFN